jgi:heme-degrading monooxygenase HmoA
MDSRAASTPQPPYYAVIFTSRRTDGHDADYGRASERMLELARAVPGYLGVESVRDAEGVGITVSYWESEEAIRRWREHAEHRVTQKAGRDRFYQWYEVRVCRVERAKSFRREGTGPARRGEG